MLESHGTRGTENAVMTGRHTFEGRRALVHAPRLDRPEDRGFSKVDPPRSAIFSLRARQPDATRNRVARARARDRIANRSQRDSAESARERAAELHRSNYISHGGLMRGNLIGRCSASGNLRVPRPATRRIPANPRSVEPSWPYVRGNGESPYCEIRGSAGSLAGCRQSDAECV